MTGPTHAIIGLTAAVISARVSDVTLSAPVLLAVLLGSLAPDIDGNGAITRPGRLIDVFLGWKAARVVDSLFVAAAGLVQLVFGHRGFVHSPIVVLGIWTAAALLELELLVWFGYGWAWHLVADFFTRGGIPLLSPLSPYRFSGGRVRVGSREEALVAAAGVLVLCVVGWPLLPEGVRATYVGLWSRL